ncbi:hypothetical protein EDB86DRAFT_2949191 [Lactarius hatsudake]|nr:hypothetical protein EDB86DRAFT_2949191 [Lactarius hatsudake]
MPRCVSSLLTTPVLGSPVECDPCVHARPSSLLMVTILGSPVHRAGYVAAYHSKPHQLRSYWTSFDPWYFTLLFLECI